MAYRHKFQQYVERIVAGGVIEEPSETRNATSAPGRAHIRGIESFLWQVIFRTELN